MFKSVLVEFENDKVKSSDWQAEIDRVYNRKWDEDPKYEASARCGALRAVIELLGLRYNALAVLYNKTLVQEEDGDFVIYWGYEIRQNYPSPSGWVWSNPDYYDCESPDAGNGTLEQCKQAIDEYLEEQDG